MSFITPGPDIVVANGDTESAEVKADGNYEGSYGIMIISPSGAETGTFSVAEKSGGTFATLQDDSETDIAIPVADKARVYRDLIFSGAFKIVLSGAAGADMTFKTCILSD